MNELDLNIQNYDLDDILNLFKLERNFDELQLKNAKKVVLMTHPDKSGLSPDYFRFYSNAYKIIFGIWEFKNKSEKKGNGTSFQMSNSQKKILDTTTKSTTDFNKWFNQEFDKINIIKDEDDNGYGDWLKSDNDISPISQLGISDDEFDKKKRILRENELILHKNMNEMYFNCIGASTLTGDVPETYSSNLFSNLQYEDLHKAHTETVVPVTIDDFNNVKKFSSVDEYKRYRNIEQLHPLNGEEYLQNKMKKEDAFSTNCAYKLAKQSEQLNINQKLFWGNLMKLKM